MTRVQLDRLLEQTVADALGVMLEARRDRRAGDATASTEPERKHRRAAEQALETA